MNPSLYDLLDVDPGASDDEIRAAWKAAIADLGPSDRRFRAYNQAAEVLLDPEKRSAYDAELAESDEEEDEVEEPGLDTGSPGSTSRSGSPQVVEPASAASGVETTTTDAEVEESAEVEEVAQQPSRDRRPPATWIVATVAAVALAVLAVTIWMWVDRFPREDDQAWVDSAIDAASEAAPKALAYDYRSLDDDIAEAQSLMTEEQQAKHNELIAGLRSDIEAQQAVVEAQVLGAGLVRGDEERADVLVFVNQLTTKAPEGGGERQEVLIPSWVRFQMVRDDGEWLLDRMVTEGVVASSGNDENGSSPSPSATSSPSPDPTTSPTSP